MPKLTQANEGLLIDNPPSRPQIQTRMTTNRTDEDKIHFAGFPVRCIASIIDFVLVLLVSWGLELALLGFAYELLSWTGRVQGDFDDFLDPFILQSVTLSLYLAVSFTYYFLSHFHWGATIGKALMGIRVVDFGTGGGISRTQSRVRWIALTQPFGIPT